MAPCYGQRAGQIYNSWSTTVKITWDVPRSTHRFLVDNLLAADFLTVKQQLLGRYVNFFHGLLKSLSPEVRIVCQHDGQVCLVNTRKESDVLGEGDRAGPFKENSGES